ncbi:RDD family protein [Thermomonas sp. S9]|uniref:RDD family protein n=1 Tax=Thermomonas sp. S9 TaxID=2885203 RepID=UPI00216ABF40|nr:RDD family protein [Thermomonas sp. S9]MCR6494887.1 RDD family protein [Thermomonas sp. S9]
MPDRPSSLIGWRLLALLYDLFPALALWFVVAAAFTLVHGDAVRGGALGLLEFAALWLVTGLYATWSWHRGGQTLGMRPWRLHLVAVDGGRPGWRALWLRYALGGVSLLAGGLGFWWAWLDRDRLTWHDRLSRTRLLRGQARPLA